MPSANGKKLKVAGVRLTEEELDAFKDFADRRGRTVSQELRLQIRTLLHTKKISVA